MARRGSRAAALAALGMLLGCLWPLLSPAADAHAAHSPARPTHAADRIIVKWRAAAGMATTTAQDRAQRVRALGGLPITAARNLFNRTDVFKLEQALTPAAMQTLLARLNADPGIEYAEADGYRYIADFPATAPNDPNFVAGSDTNGSWNGQWYLLPSSSATPAAISATTAWQATLGSPNVVVAVIDTGIIESHPDFTYPSGASSTPKLACTTDGTTGAPYCGYDFVSCDQGNLTSDSGSQTTADCSASGSSATYYFANDGHGWAEDASDPGDWIDATDTATTLFQDAGCTTVEPSSWHGTKVAGVIGAVTDNGIGIAGIAPNTTLLPVRALGACTGRVSDIAAAILWAAGIAVTGVPANRNPGQHHQHEPRGQQPLLFDRAGCDQPGDRRRRAGGRGRWQ